MKKFWCFFFVFWPLVALWLCWVAPNWNYWFPIWTPTGGEPTTESASPLGYRIDDLFYMILVIVTITFILTHIALGWVLWKGATKSKDTKAWFTHGSHSLEVMWTIVPSVILLFIAFVQLDVWADFRVTSMFPEEAREAPVAAVTARQFEWRIRYPAPGKTLQRTPQPDDLYTVNDLHVPTGRPVMIYLETQDVQHSFFLPELRVKQDAVPGLQIPVWFEATKAGDYTLVCAELCGWGHYKMGARLVAESESGFAQYLENLQEEQNDDGVPDSTDDDE